MPEGERREQPIRAFISYSHDSEEHREGVLEFAYRRRGERRDPSLIEAILLLDMQTMARNPMLLERAVENLFQR